MGDRLHRLQPPRAARRRSRRPGTSERVQRLGPVMPPEDKDAALFPRRFDGRWAMIHRPSPLRGGAHMWLSYSPDLRHWGDHKLLLEARDGAWWDAGKIGLGPPPLETAEGWLVMYHGVQTTARRPDLSGRPRAARPRRPDARVLHRTRRVGLRARSAVRDHRRRRPGRVPVRLDPRSRGATGCHLYYGAADSVIGARDGLRSARSSTSSWLRRPADDPIRRVARRDEPARRNERRPEPDE